MKVSLLGICFFVISMQWSHAQQNATTPTAVLTATQQKIMLLSKEKWQWMSEKNVDKLAHLFHDQSKFVHMSGTWKKN